MQHLYVLYDDRCGLCRWIKGWATEQPAFIPLVFIPAGEAERLIPGASTPGVPEELVVVSDEGEVYRGDSAWIMCFYALEEFREWSLRLASPALRPLARKAFALVSRHRVNVSDWLGLTDDEAARVFGRVDAPACEIDGSPLRRIHVMNQDSKLEDDPGAYPRSAG